MASMSVDNVLYDSIQPAGGGFSRSLMQLVLFDPHLVLALHSGGVISRIGPCRIAASHAGLGFRA